MRRRLANVALIGDQVKAAAWKRYAHQKLDELSRLPLDVVARKYQPVPGVLIIVKKVFDHSKIIIIADSTPITYEFFVSDDIDAEDITSPGQSATPGEKCVTGDVCIYLPKYGLAMYAGPISSIDGPELNTSYWTDFKIWSSQGRVGPTHYLGKARLSASNASSPRYRRNLAARLGNFNTSIGTGRSLIRDDGYNIVSTAFAPDGSTRSFTKASFPNEDGIGRFAESDEDFSLTRPEEGHKWHSRGCLAKATDGTPVFLYFDQEATKLYVFPVGPNETTPIPSQATVVGTYDLVLPEWAENPERGYFQWNSDIQWSFNNDGTRFAGVLYQHEAQTIKISSSVTKTLAETAVNIIDPDPNVAGLSRVILGASHDGTKFGAHATTPNPGTFDQIFAAGVDSYTSGSTTFEAKTTDQPLYKLSPGLVEYSVSVEAERNDDGEITALLLTVAQEYELFDEDRYPVAVDYDFRSNRMVTCELECFLKNGEGEEEDPVGSLFADGPPPIPADITIANNDPQGVNTVARIETVMYEIGDHVEVEEGEPEVERTLTEKRRFVSFHGALSYDQIAFGSLSAANVGIAEFFDTSGDYFIFHLGGLDLRNQAYWGWAQDIAQPGEVWRGYSVYGFLDKDPVYNHEEGGVSVPPDWLPPERGDLVQTSPRNSVTQAVYAVCHDYHFYGEFASHPYGGIALCTPVFYVFQGNSVDGYVYSPRKIDFIYSIFHPGVTKTITHQSVYSNLRTNLSAIDPPPSTPPEKTWVDYGFDGDIVSGVTFYGPMTVGTNIGHFATGGVFFSEYRKNWSQPVKGRT